MMLNSIKNETKISSKLEMSIGENVRDSLIKTGIKAAEESAYAAGNTTEKLVGVAEKAGSIIDRATELAGGSESASALGKIAFKTTKDIARGDSVCTGLCLVSGACESICSTIQIIPFRGRIYVCTKVVSKGCMAFRNACAGEGC